MTSDELWQSTLAELELNLSRANFTTWFKSTFVLEYEENKVVIGVPNAFTKTWLENKYHSQILKALQNITDQKVKEVSYKVFSNQKKIAKLIQKEVAPKKETPVKVISPVKKNAQLKQADLNDRYVFENFVVGKKNELAHAACLAVGEKLGSVYNPLFIYGGVGLGKTHLMQAIGHKILEGMPNKKILYVPCETFTNEFIKSISMGQADKFKDKYRGVDALLIDDIQFLAGKEGTQEAFFHTFNHLHQQNKQIVITSDRPPKAIPTLENRLISRFEWGMIVDVGAPDLETRIAILKNKCAEKNFTLEDEMVVFIATTVQSNIRELEGALNRVIASYQLSGDKPTLDSVKKLLSSISQSPKKGALTAKKIITAVSEYYEIKTIDILGNCRKKELVVPRQIVMFIMRDEMTASYPSIGRELGGRDHTTAMHAYNKIKKMLEDDEKLEQDINLIKQKLFN